MTTGNWSNKEIISIYNWTDINDDREESKEVIINGRTYIKCGIATATTATALQYKVYDPSINSNKYYILIGVAKQNPCDVCVNEEIGYEIATENAMTNPVAVLKFDGKVSDDVIKLLIKSYVVGMPVEFVKTNQELKAEGKNVNDYVRNSRYAYNYYEDYYKNFKKLNFFKKKNI